MPTALMLLLRPSVDVTVAPHLGRSAHAAFFQAIAERDAGLAQRLHDIPTVKPFAVSDLLGTTGGSQGRIVKADRTYGLRWTCLSPELDAFLPAFLTEPPSKIELDGHDFVVEKVTSDPLVDAWAGVAEWSELVALERIGREAPPHRFILEFVAPTTFRSNGRNIPLPLPELVFGSLVDRWNNFSPITLPVEVRRYAAECLVLGHYTLRSTRIDTFGGRETAFTGRCTFVATNRDCYYLHCCAALLRLAFFSGVGAKASMGFGMTRWKSG